MDEAFLHYIWQYQHFNRSNLATSAHEAVRVLDPGFRNDDAGPDFGQARLLIDDLEWRGSVEIHVRASDWNRHRHSTDPAYENVVLHVVWQNDTTITRADETEIATLELRDRVDPTLLRRYAKLIGNGHRIPCARVLSHVDPFIVREQITRAAIQRLEARTGLVRDDLVDTRGDWDETAYRMLARNFGFKVNAAAFGDLARALPHRTLLRHLDHRQQVEALLFGVAGMLNHPSKEPYVQALATEYRHLRNKYRLGPRELPPAAWKFLRLRPANFPTLRLAQFAAVISTGRNLMDNLALADDDAVRSLLSAGVSGYWENHYRFGKTAKAREARLGIAGIENILINTVVPLRYEYGIARDLESFREKAVALMERLPPEANAIVRTWKDLGVPARSALETQGMLEQYKHFCLRRQCLNCKVGVQLLKPPPP